MLHKEKTRSKAQSVVRIAIMVCAVLAVVTLIVEQLYNNKRWNSLYEIEMEADRKLQSIASDIEYYGLTEEVIEQIEGYSNVYTRHSNFVVVDGQHRVLYALNQGYLSGGKSFFAAPLYDESNRDVLYIMDEQGELMSSHNLRYGNSVALYNLSKPLQERLRKALDAISQGMVGRSGEGRLGAYAGSSFYAVEVNGASSYQYEYEPVEVTFADAGLFAQGNHEAQYFGFPSKGMHMFFFSDGYNPLYHQRQEAIASTENIVGAMIAVVIFSMIGYFLLVPVWVFLDASRREYHPALWGILALFTNVVGLIIYLVVRPEMQHCKSCKEPVRADYVLCPVCGTRNRETCAKCGRIVNENWNLCPYCATPINREAAQEGKIEEQGAQEA